MGCVQDTFDLPDTNINIETLGFRDVAGPCKMKINKFIYKRNTSDKFTLMKIYGEVIDECFKNYVIKGRVPPIFKPDDQVNFLFTEKTDIDGDVCYIIHQIYHIKSKTLYKID